MVSVADTGPASILINTGIVVVVLPGIYGIIRGCLSRINIGQTDATEQAHNVECMRFQRCSNRRVLRPARCSEHTRYDRQAGIDAINQIERFKLIVIVYQTRVQLIVADKDARYIRCHINHSNDQFAIIVISCCVILVEHFRFSLSRSTHSQSPKQDRLFDGHSLICR